MIMRVIESWRKCFIVAVNGRFEQIDVFESTPLFNKLWPKLLKSYALDAANTNGDSQVDLADAIYALNHQFQGAAPPPYPYPGCNPAPTPLGCLFPACP